MISRKSLVGLAGIVMALVGCASVSTAGWSNFEPYDGPNGQPMFKYYALSNSLSKENDPVAEQERIAYLEKYLSRNKYCPKGYKIISRKVAWYADGALDGSKIYYVGVCN